jgi:hypothetical protein
VRENTKNRKFVVIGFKSTAVFGYSQTNGEPLPGEEG